MPRCSRTDCNSVAASGPENSPLMEMLLKYDPLLVTKQESSLESHTSLFRVLKGGTPGDVQFLLQHPAAFELLDSHRKHLLMQHPGFLARMLIKGCLEANRRNLAEHVQKAPELQFVNAADIVATDVRSHALLESVRRELSTLLRDGGVFLERAQPRSKYTGMVLERRNGD